MTVIIYGYAYGIIQVVVNGLWSYQPGKDMTEKKIKIQDFMYKK